MKDEQMIPASAGDLAIAKLQSDPERYEMARQLAGICAAEHLMPQLRARASVMLDAMINKALDEVLEKPVEYRYVNGAKVRVK